MELLHAVEQVRQQSGLGVAAQSAVHFNKLQPLRQLTICRKIWTLRRRCRANGHVHRDCAAAARANLCPSSNRVLVSGAQAIEHGHVPAGMYVVTALLLGGAFFRPAPRVAAFATVIVIIVLLYGKEVRTVLVQQ